MNPTKSLPRQLAVALTALVVGSTQARALEPTDVIAESARARLTVADYEAELAKLPADSRKEFAASALRLKQYLDNLYIARVLAADARAEGLDKDPVLARQIATQVDKLLAQAQVERIEAAAAAEFDKSRRQVHCAGARALPGESGQVRLPEQRARGAHPGQGQGGKRDAALAKANGNPRQGGGGRRFRASSRANSRTTRPYRRTAANSASSRRRRWTRRSRPPRSR